MLDHRGQVPTFGIRYKTWFLKVVDGGHTIREEFLKNFSKNKQKFPDL